MLENTRSLFQKTASAVGWLVSSDRTTSPPAPLSNTIDAIALTAIEGGYSAGIAVGVALPIKTPVASAFGHANLPAATPITTHSRFRAGACVRQFTAAAILMLVERGELHLDDTADRFVQREFAAGGITVRTLLTGEAKAYRILARIIEQVTGETFATFVTEQLLMPAGMTDSCLSDGEAGRDTSISGYRLMESRAHVFDEIGTGDRSAAADSLCTTAGDLLLWNRALHNGWLLTHATVDTMTQAAAEVAPCAVLSPFLNRYARGLGIEVGRLLGRRAFWQRGQAPGFDAWLFHFPDDRTDLALLSNTEQGAATILEPMLRAVLRV